MTTSWPASPARGPTASDGLAKPDLVTSGRLVVSLRAPGSKVDAAYPDSRVETAYFKGSGTSFATAVASGGAALVVARQPGLSPDQVKGRLLSTARPGPVGDPQVDGHGSLDAYAAAHAAGASPANQGVPRSLGTGSLAADRGSLEVQIQTSPSSLTSPTLLSGEVTAQGLLFDQVGYLTSAWTESSWYGSSWYGSSWYGSSWYGSSWYAAGWE